MTATPWLLINSSTPSHVEERVDDPPAARPTTWRSRSARSCWDRGAKRTTRQHLTTEREQERLAEERRDPGQKLWEGDAAALAFARHGARSRWRLEPAGVDEGGGDGGGGGGEASPGAGRDGDQEEIKADARAAAAEFGEPTRTSSSSARRSLRNVKYGTADSSHAVEH